MSRQAPPRKRKRAEYVRCPTCGHLVILPCFECALSANKAAIKLQHRVEDDTRDTKRHLDISPPSGKMT